MQKVKSKNELTTTLNIIKSKQPCSDGWKLLLKSLGKTKPDDEALSLMYILESNGINDAIWALRCFDYKEYCLFLADVADSVLHIFEDKCTDDKRVRLCIQGIRDYHAGKITIEELKNLSASAADAAAYAASAAAASAADADAAAYAASAAAAYAASAAAASAAAAAAYAAYAASAADAAAAASAASAADAAAAARGNKYKEIKVLFVKHFGSNQ